MVKCFEDERGKLLIDVKIVFRVSSFLALAVYRAIKRVTNTKLISFRFDLIFLMLDPQDELYDRRLASHLVSLYHLSEREAEEEFLVTSSLLVLIGPSCFPWAWTFLLSHLWF